MFKIPVVVCTFKKRILMPLNSFVQMCKRVQRKYRFFAVFVGWLKINARSGEKENCLMSSSENKKVQRTVTV